ncbi:MAG TPA: (2Fe-2S)-binding protein, partial [Polyangiaceae bacterium LLY-WYZ-15_(1-7)]|nr:(2Fe-2S)-binding protein [Polyangiaceae bacterium LLY-WYZ-15_(1-7)]
GVPAPGPPVEVREGTLAVGVFDEVGFGFTTGEPEPAEPVRWVLLEDARGLIRLRPRALVVATGAFAGAEAFAGNDRPGVLSPRAALRLLDAGVLVGQRVALVGAGPELERAAARLKAAGAETLGPFEASGVDAVGGRPSVRYLRVGETKHACDAVVSAAPPTGAYVLAGQAGAGLRFDGRGFLVAADEHGRTAHPAVFAAGRCTGRVGEGAARQAREAGRGAARVARGEVPAAFTPERPSPAPAERGALPRSASDKVVVCRCEDVTLHELEEAVARGHRDLEAAKRYTGFATGWCQGKQCVSLCARALAALGGEVADAPITPRPPLRPVPLAELARLVDDGEGA